MKKFICCIIVFLAFASCGTAEKEARELAALIKAEAAEKSICDDFYEDTAQSFAAQYEDGFAANDNPLIEGADFPLDFIAHYSGNFSDDWYFRHFGRFDNFMDMFEDDFFAENYLVVFQFRKPTVSLDYNVAKVLANGDIILKPTRRGGGGDAISTWTVVIELDNRFVPEDFNVIFVGDDSWPWWWHTQYIPVEIIRRNVSDVREIPAQADSVVSSEFITNVNRPTLIAENVVEFLHAQTLVYTIHENGNLRAWRNNHITQSAMSVLVMDNAQTILAAPLLCPHTPHYAIDANGVLWQWNWTERLLSPIMEDVRWAENHMLITNDGGLYSWGLNGHGQVGDGTFTKRYTPVRIMENVRAAFSHGFHSEQRMAITEDGYLYTWGSNRHGQLGDGTRSSSNYPRRVMANVSDVIISGQRFSAFGENEGVWSWGQSFGIENPAPIRSRASNPVIATFYSASSGRRENRLWQNAPLLGITRMYVQTSSRVNTYFGLKENGELWTWEAPGRSHWIDERELNETPIRIMQNVASVHVGANYVIVLKSDNTLWAFGENGRSQLGDGTTENRAEPVFIMENVVEVSVTHNQNVALTIDGNLYAWGANICGQDFPHLESPTIFRTEDSVRNHTPFFRIIENHFAIS